MTEASFDCVMNMLTHSLNGSLRLNSFSVFRVRGTFHVTRVLEMVNTEIRLIIFFAAKDGEALYSQQKQDQELTVAQIINSLLPNSDLY